MDQQTMLMLCIIIGGYLVYQNGGLGGCFAKMKMASGGSVRRMMFDELDTGSAFNQ